MWLPSDEDIDIISKYITTTSLSVASTESGRLYRHLKIIDTVVSTVYLLVLKLGFKKYIFEITEAKSIMLCDAVSLVCWRTSQTALVHVQQAGAEIAEWSKLINLENKYKI